MTNTIPDRVAIETAVGTLTVAADDKLELRFADGVATLVVQRPLALAQRAALVALAMHFDERHDARAKLAAEAREDEPTEFPEQDAIARTWKNAADATWDLVGGRPGTDDGGQRFIRIGLRELGKLVEMADDTDAHDLLTRADVPDYTGVRENDRPMHLVERIAALIEERDATRAKLASMPCELPTLNDLAKAFNTGYIPLAGLEAIESMLRARVAPFLAAQTAAIEMHKASAEHYRKAFEQASARVAELEAMHEALAVVDREFAKLTLANPDGAKQ